MAALYSLVGCGFGRTGISAETYMSLVSAATGWKIDYQEFMRIGERIWNLTRLFSVREGFDRNEDRLCKRFQEPLPSGPAIGHRFTDQDVDNMLDYGAGAQKASQRTISSCI